MPGTISVAPSGNQDTDGLLAGMKWDTVNLSFSFPSNSEFYGTTYAQGENLSAFEPLNSIQKAVVRDIFGAISSVTNLVFTELTESATTHATLRFGMSDDPGTAWAYYPSSSEVGGDSWYNNSSGGFDAPVIGNYAYYVFMHEIGHNLGLKHGHETSGYGSMAAPHDSMEYSVMTYRSYVGSDAAFVYNETWGYAQTLMMYDIAALQHMYGADFTTNATNSVYRWNATTGEMSINGNGQGIPGDNRVFMTIWDGGGSDTYDLSNYGTGVTIDLRPGEWTTTSAVQIAHLGHNNYARGNIASALQFNGDARSLIENAIGGSGNDTIFGNAAANVLNGGGGSDTIVLAGTRANYTFSGTASSLSATGYGVIDSIRNAEFVRFLGSNETVTVTSLLDGGSTGVTITGTATNDVISPTVTVSGQPLPTTSGDTIYGLAGADQLDGGQGGDRMVGGIGNDTYTVENSGDQVIELTGEGTDLVKTFISYTLPDYIEKLTLSGSLAINGTGNSLNNIMTGNGAANQLVGLGGNDQLDGGQGGDRMVGGIGNDTYTVENSGDQVIELAGEGTDLVKTFISYTLPDHIEKLTLSGSLAINGTGNSLNNIMTGNGAANQLVGLGGNDQLNGGNGNDYLDGGIGDDTLLGSAGVDILIGGDGLDKLTGGAGRDSLTGNAQADRFIFQNINESTIALSDTIMDFSRLEGDKIDLAKIDANTITANNQAFTFIGTNAFSGGGAAGAGQLRYQQVNGETHVSGDVNGDGSADFMIKLMTPVTLQSTDFFL